MIVYVTFIKYQSKYLGEHFKIDSDPIRTDRFSFFWREKVFELVKKINVFFSDVSFIPIIEFVVQCHYH